MVTRCNSLMRILWWETKSQYHPRKRLCENSRLHNIAVPGSTLKALANSSPGLLQPWDPVLTLVPRTLKEFAKAPATVSQRFQRYDFSLPKSQGCSNPGLELANAFSVIRRTLSFHSLGSWWIVQIVSNGSDKSFLMGATKLSCGSICVARSK
jgi:hypothetical protein